MDIRCPSCSKLFRVADEKIDGKGIRFKCSKCSEVITITKDDFEMDLLAREGEAVSPAVQQSAPAPKPAAATTPPQPTPEPEAREYMPPVEQTADEASASDQQLPATSLGDFDFSEPHAAATAAAHPDDGFGGTGFSFDAGAEQGAAPEIEISPEAAAEAEAALQFPDDLISEPKRKPAFGNASPEVPEPEAEAGPAVTDQELDLGAVLAMPKGPVFDDEPAATDNEPAPGSAPTAPKGPVISPELLAQMKRNALDRSAAQARTTAPAGDEIDLGAALAMPKTKNGVYREAAEAGTDSAAARPVGEMTSSRKPLLIIGGVAVLLVIIAVAVLYSLEFLGRKSAQEAKQQSQSKSQAQSARKEITPEGLSIVAPAAYFDPERGDIVINGKIQNNLDAPKAGWYLVIEIRDAKETVLTTVKMMNGVQLYTDKDQEVLVQRGVKPEEIRKLAVSRQGTISGRGSVSFEMRVLNPPAGSAGFLPTLRSFDPATLGEGK